MFASQLSRILQTLPADVNYDTCSAFDSTEEKTSMKENQPEIICISDGKEADLFSFGKKGMFDSNGFVADSDHLAYDARDRDEFSKVPVLDCDALVDCSLKSIENKSEGLQAKDDQNGLFHFIAQKTGEDTFASDTKDSDRYSPEFESYMIVNSTDHKDQCVLSSAVSASDVSHLCTDKSVIEHELPKLIVCYQESNYYPVRDICVDKGVPALDKVSVESQKGDHAGTRVSLRCDGDKNSDLRDGTDSELLSGDRSTVQDANSHYANECINKEREDTALPVHDCPKLSSKVNINKHAANDTFLEDLVKLFGSKCSANEKVVNDLSEKEFFGDRSLHLDSSAAQNSQKSVVSFNFDDNVCGALPDQKPSEEENLAGNTAISTTDESIKNDPATCLVYNSEVESVATTDKSTRTVAVEVLEPETEPCHKEGNPDKMLAMPACQVQCIDSACAHSPELQDVANSEDKAKVNHSITSQDQYADGEASFAALGSITYLGSIPYSGSISLRSDSSTTSARSFAFPILQSEWNSSPVKMKKADRRLQKHRGWRQGLLCCRF